MVLVSIVLIVTFITIGISTYQRLVSESYVALEENLSKLSAEGMPKRRIEPPRNEPPDDKKPMNNNVVFKVVLNSDNKIYKTVGNVEISDEVLNELIQQCINDNKPTGTISSQDFRYMMKDKHGVTEIAFYDLSSEQTIMYNLIITFTLVGLASLGAFFIISLYLAKWALKPVEKSWEQQRQFIADASHELKTPLTVILANTDVLAAHKGETIQSQLKWLDYIKTESTRMKGLVNDLLFLAKSDASRNTVVTSIFNFSDLVWSCVLPFESIAYEQGKDLQSDIKSDISFKGDEGKLKQLIMILLDNACKYSDEKGVIKINLSQKQDKILLEITNSGEPIPAQHLPHLFERFYRADESRARELGGYGLGLSIAQNIVEMHHGKISVTSTKEAGTTFYVIF